MQGSNRLLLIFGESLEFRELALEYWAGTEVGGRFNWNTSVEDIAEVFGVPKSEILRLCKQAATAVNLSVRCSDCRLPQELSSRSSLTLRGYGGYICGHCTRARNESRRSSEEKARNHTRTEQQRILDNVRTRNKTFDYSGIGYFEAMLCFGIMLASDDAAEQGRFRDTDRLNLCGSASLSSKMLGRLFDTGILAFDETTPPEAIQIVEGGAWRYFPHKVHWEFAQDVEERSFPKLMSVLGAVLDLQEDDPDFGSSVVELWRLLAYDDAFEHLSTQVEDYRLPELRVGPKTDQALWYALEHFSIPQVRREISNVVKNAAALSQHRDYARRHALNTIPGTLISYVDRALSEGWQISCVLRNWQNEEPVLLTLLFNRVLRTGLPGFKSTSLQYLRAQFQSGKTATVG